MKNLIALSLLFASACAGSSAALSRRSSAESIVGEWRGVLVKGVETTPAEFQFTTSRDGYRGSYWSRALTLIALTNVESGQLIHFEIPGGAVFDGAIQGDAMTGKFNDGNGGGSFRLEKQTGRDNPDYVD